MKLKAMLVLAALYTAGAAAWAADLEFLERFALSSDRAKLLDELIPGTEDYYFFTCLYDQQTGRLDDVDAILTTWIERHGRTERVEEIQNRQALLRYPDQPERSIEYLKSALALDFDHQRQLPGESPDLPTKLDALMIGREALLKRALADPRYSATVKGFTPHAYEWLLSVDLDENRRRDLLHSLDLPDYPKLPALIAKDLQAPRSSGFGSLGIHSLLTTAQLDELLALMPELIDNDAYIGAYIQRLIPSNDQLNWRTVPLLYGTYLDRLCAFTDRLGSAQNSLRAHALYHRLHFKMTQGNYDKDDFEAYLRLPRVADYVPEEYLRRSVASGTAADLERDFAQSTGLPQIHRDETVVRRYLQHYFEGGTKHEAFKTFIREDYLRRLYAETKLLQGAGDLEQWYSWLEPSAVEELKKRVDVEFAPENKQDFAPDEPVKLALWIKNVDRLLVRVFAIDAKSYYQNFNREVNTDIDLDGLVANHEDVQLYSDPPLKRVKREFEFPELTGRGVWVVECVGNGMSSRAVVQKGRLQYLSRTGAAGQMFTVFDETGQKLPDASLWFSGQTFSADEKGEIAVPFSTEPAEKQCVLMHRDFATLASFQHETEAYQLVANFQLDSESVRAGAVSRVAVRPLLYLNAAQMPLTLIKNPVLNIASQTHDGISSRQEIRDFALKTDELSLQSFRVPENVAHIQFALSGTVDRLLTPEPAQLLAEKTFLVNGINATQQTASLFLSRFAQDYILEMRDKTGLPLPERAVNLSMKHTDFADEITTDLMTDSDGRIALGPLVNIDRVTTNAAGLATQSWSLNQSTCNYPPVLQANAKAELHIPYAADGAQAGDVSLLEVRAGSYSANRSDALQIANGYIAVSGLSPGDYLLHIKPLDRRIQIRITAGELAPYYIASSTRLMRIDQPTSLQIQSVEASNDAIRIQLGGANEFTRVHYTATRFLPDSTAFAQLSARQDPNSESKPVILPDTLYQSGRYIGDEFQYVLERRFATKFPGNMLERPSLILNPWSLKETQAEQQPAAAPGPPPPAVLRQKEVRSESEPSSGDQPATEAQPYSPNFDFLGGDAAGAHNLKPDADGAVAIPIAELNGRNHVQIVATDPSSTVSRYIALPEIQVPLRDLRLAKPLDSTQHFVERKRVQFLDAGETLRVHLTGDTDLQLYDTVPAVYALLRTLNGDPKLADFEFVTRWPSLTPEEKRDYFSRFASHELNFFLYNKDREFFDQVVRPYIGSKYAKTFLDTWLVDGDLRPYLEPWRFNQLNIVEKILLSRRIVHELPSTQRLLQESLDMIPPDPNRLDSLFMTALYGGVLGSGGGSDWGFGHAGGGGFGGGGLQNVQVGGSIQIRANYFSDMQLGEQVDENGAVPMEANSDGVAQSIENPAGQAGFDAFGVAENRAARVAEGKPRLLALAAQEAERLQALGYQSDEKRDRYRALYQAVRKTEEWVENSYYKLPIAQQHPGLVPVNAYWTDFAQAEPGTPFRSAHIAEASANFAEILLALAVLDLPFEAPEQPIESGENALTVSAASPLIAFFKDLGTAQSNASDSPILIGQNYFRLDDKYRYEGNERFDKFVKDEFIRGVVYGCQITVTNPTSMPRQVEVLRQIPQGALPVSHGRYTKSDRLRLEAYSTATLRYDFYFPKAGAFDHFPAHVSEDGELLAFAEPQHMTIVETPTVVDTASWQYISQQGSEDEVLEFLNATNLNRVDLSAVAWRMRDKETYDRVIELLERRHVYNPILWSYAIYHNDPARLTALLRFSDEFAAKTGAYFSGPLLTIDPIERKAYQHVEYAPLINPRAHQLGAKWTITNEQLGQQYASLMNILAHRDSLDQDDRMALTYYLLLQDRVSDALPFFKQVAPDKLETRIQYDYFAAFLAFSQENPGAAVDIAARYADYPVKRWRELFAAVREQAADIGDGKSPVTPSEGHSKQDTLAGQAPRLDLEVKDDSVIVYYANLTQCEVSLYPIDLEMLFTRSPFAPANSGVFAGVKPAMDRTIQLDPGQTQLEMPLDEAFANAHVVIKVEAAGISRSDIRYASRLVAQLAESYGQVQVSDKTENKPLAKVYVKVFAQMQNGEAMFYRDGYTDLRGRFDYASSSTLNVGDVSQFGILILSDEFGARVMTAKPPVR